MLLWVLSSCVWFHWMLPGKCRVDQYNYIENCSGRRACSQRKISHVLPSDCMRTTPITDKAADHAKHARRLLCCCSETRSYYKVHIRENYIAHDDETDPQRIAEIVEKAKRDAAWVVEKVSRSYCSA